MKRSWSNVVRPVLRRVAPVEDEWAEVSDWPAAFVNEVEKRLRACPGDVRLDDLRDRLKRRTRSGAELLQ